SRTRPINRPAPSANEKANSSAVMSSGTSGSAWHGSGKSATRLLPRPQAGEWPRPTIPQVAMSSPSHTVSLTRFLIEAQRAGRINADLRQLIAVVARACTSISIAVGKGALGGVLGEAGTGNIQGEAQKKLDVLSNEILLEANAWGGHLAGLASEEMDHSQPIPDAARRGRYLLLFDPLDGSSNIDVNVSVGTIFSVLRCPEGVTEPSDEHFLQPGT